MRPSPLKTRMMSTYTECVGKLFPPCPCNVLVLAGTETACEVCEPYIVSVRENLEWKPIHGTSFFIRDGLSEAHKNQVLAAVGKKLEEAFRLSSQRK